MRRQEQLLAENLGNKRSGGAGGHITEDGGSEKQNGDNRERTAVQHGLDRLAGRAEKSKPEAERSKPMEETDAGMKAGTEEAGEEVESGLQGLDRASATAFSAPGT